MALGEEDGGWLDGAIDGMWLGEFDGDWMQFGRVDVGVLVGELDGVEVGEMDGMEVGDDDGMVDVLVLWMGSSKAAAWRLRGCGCGRDLLAIAKLARSAAVSVATQNAGGELVQPMGRTNGKATRGGVPGLVGNTRPNFGTSFGLTSMR